jgi:hypothetical protein
MKGGGGTSSLVYFIPSPHFFPTNSRSKKLELCSKCGLQNTSEYFWWFCVLFVLVLRMSIPDPDFYPSQIPDPTTSTKEGEKLVVQPFFVVTSIKKLKLFYFLKRKFFSTFYP